MSYQVEELVVPAFAHVAGSGITVDCSIMYVPNGWWKHRRDLTTGQKIIAEFLCGEDETSDSITKIIA
jgi:hypothetical protein